MTTKQGCGYIGKGYKSCSSKTLIQSQKNARLCAEKVECELKEAKRATKQVAETTNFNDVRDGHRAALSRKSLTEYSSQVRSM